MNLEEITILGQAQWLKPIIIATWVVEIKRIAV
jgi:hypothetical protein